MKGRNTRSRRSFPRGSSSSMLIFAGALTLFGCGERASSEQLDVGVATAAHSTAVAPGPVMGFESAQFWLPTSGSVATSNLHMEGARSLAVTGGGWRVLESHAMTKPETITKTVGYSLRLPTHQPNRWWRGQAMLFVHAPSAGIWNQYIGATEFNGKPLGQFFSVAHAVPNWVVDALASHAPADLRFRIALNVPSDARGVYHFDHLHFIGGTDLCVGVNPDDGNPCTRDACDPATGVSHVALDDGASCTDEDACNGAEACLAGDCVAGAAPDLDDGNPCTSDACEPTAGVTHVAVADGTSCADADACNGAEACLAGACAAGTAPVVDDGNPCTADACDPATGVLHVALADGTSCADADACNGAEACLAGACSAGTPPALNDGNPCTADACDPAAGVTHVAVADGTSCADADVCDGAEACLAGACSAGTPPALDDGNPCTVDDCDPTAGVAHLAVADGTSCADADLCDGAETCLAGACSAGTPLTLDDTNPCTADACDPATGVAHVSLADGTACADGDLCNGAEVCLAGACADGVEPVIDDGNPCTADACDPAVGVSQLALANGASCADADACNGAETCQSGTCTAGTPVVEDDGDPCTADTCDPVTGAPLHPPAIAGTACPDQDLCDGVEVCDGTGLCIPGPTLDVDDDDPSTLDSCDPLLGPVHRPVPPLDTTIATTVFNASEWLYTEDDPVQTGVGLGSIARHRAAVVHGRVLDLNGIPMPGVTVRTLHHDEFGATSTYADGRFQMVVNGGGRLTFTFTRDGYLESQRSLEVPWNDEPVLDDLVLIQPDPALSTLDLTLTEPIQVARGTPVSDADGTRQATLLVPAGTVATMGLPDGSTEELTTLSVRLTEFSVGERGPSAMPAELPPATAFTYAVELEADESVAAASEIAFDQPLVLYVDNFLAFPVGATLPHGAYDRDRAMWVPEPSGQVIAIVSVTSDAADLDLDGDGAADPPAALDALGVTLDERIALADLYAPGDELWRAELERFAGPVALNLPQDLPAAPTPIPVAAAAPVDGASQPPSEGDCQASRAAGIDCQDRTLSESISIAGTSHSLTYRSDRVPGDAASRQVAIPLSGSVIEPTVESIHLSIQVAGRSFQYTFAPAPDLMFPFTWDGNDAYGRPLQGAFPLRVVVTHRYPATYWSVDTFGDPHGTGTVTGVASRGPSQVAQRYPVIVQRWDAVEQGLGGWSIDGHHAYAPGPGRLYPGNGPTRASATTGAIIERVAGGGTNTAEGAPARQALIRSDAQPNALAVGRDGSVYFPDGSPGTRIRRLDPQGFVTTVAGTTVRGFAGDGGPATLAQFNGIAGFAFATDGTLYIADWENHRVRRVAPDGTVSTFMGTGVLTNYYHPNVPEGLPANSVGLRFPTAVATSPDGSVYVGQLGMVWRVDAANTAHYVAGAGHSMVGGCDATVGAPLSWMGVSDLSLSADGALYIADTGCGHYRQVGLDAIARDVPGIGAPWATSAGPRGISLDDRGIVYALATGSWAPTLYSLRLGSTVLRPLASGVSGSGYIDRGSAVGAKDTRINAIDLAPDGTIYGLAHTQAGTTFVVRIHSGMPTLRDGEALVPSRDGSEAYRFDLDGRHLETLDTRTSTARLTLARDARGLVTSLTDAAGNVTTIERTADGTPQRIVAPHGQVTNLTLDPEGQLAAIAGPEGQNWQMTYETGSLLASLTDPRGGVTRIDYDASGRLDSEEDPAGGSYQLATTVAGTTDEVTRTTAVGLVSVHRTVRPEAGGVVLTTTHTDGTTATAEVGTNGTVRTTSADGTVTTELRSPDPVWGMHAPQSTTTTVLPSGITRLESRSRSVTTDPLATTRIVAETITSMRNGRFSTTTYSGTSRSFVMRPPSQTRSSVRGIDSLGRTVSIGRPNQHAVSYVYDGAGRLITVAAGSRSTERAYHATADGRNGYLASLTNSLEFTTNYEPDALGRTLFETLAGATTAFTWDGQSNLATVTPPGRPAHLQSYTPVDLLETYAPPAAGIPDPATTYQYDLDRRLTRTEQPGFVVITREYDPAGRVDLIQTPTGTIDHGYYPSSGDCTAGCARGRLATVTGPGNVGLSFGYDGSLTTGITWSGDVKGSVTWAHDADFRRSGEAVTAGGVTRAVAYGYDVDGLLTCASPTSCSPASTDALTLSYSANLPQLVGTTLGAATDSRTYDAYGAVATYTVNHSGAQVYRVVYDSAATPRDPLGRVVEKVETIRGITTTLRFAYDARGRLTAVTKNGTLAEGYTYDANGNRVTLTTPTAPISGTYDDQDRLLAYGDYLFTYAANGELASRTDTSSGEVTAYVYDALGALLRVDLPDGTVLEYSVDGQGRRVAKKLNGVVTKRWLYRDELNPVAELDASGALVWQYVYASKPNVPDYAIRASDGARFRIVSDQLGSVVLVLNVADATDVLLAARYSAFGQQEVIVGSVDAVPFGFAGGHFDADTGLIRFGARDYDPIPGRWTGKDPALNITRGGPNLLTYAGNDPVNFVDLRGTEPTIAVGLEPSAPIDLEPAGPVGFAALPGASAP